MQNTLSRHEIEQALLTANCQIDIDAALASPAAARCLEIMVLEMRNKKFSTDQDQIRLANKAVSLLADRLKKMVGNIDYQSIRAGSSNEE